MLSCAIPNWKNFHPTYSIRKHWFYKGQLSDVFVTDACLHSVFSYLVMVAFDWQDITLDLLLVFYIDLRSRWNHCQAISH